MNTRLEYEIHEQPDTLAAMLASQREAVQQAVKAIREAQPKYVVIAARGSSDNAARYAQYLFGVRLGLPVALSTPSVSMLYGATTRYDDGLVIGISQSGQSVGAVNIVQEAAAQGALTIGISNFPDSELGRSAAHHLSLSVGEEKSLAATKTYTASLAMFALLAAVWADDSSMLDDLAKLPDIARQTLAMNTHLPARAERYRFMERCVTLSRGMNFATAFEIALKLKELTYVVAEPYSSADFAHGPIAILEPGFPVVLIAPKGRTYEDMLAVRDKLRERSADLAVISNGDEALDGAHLPIRIADVPEWLSPLACVLPGQLLALGLATARGTEVDQPRGLRKVTIQE